MKNTSIEKLVILVKEQVQNAKTEEEKVENIQLLEELKKEEKQQSSKLNDSFLWSLIKNVATHEVIEAIKDIMNG